LDEACSTIAASAAVSVIRGSIVVIHGRGIDMRVLELRR
jgi:hypothetical protein